MLYAIGANSVEYTRRQVHEFTDFILRCGLNVDIDLYHSSNNIVNWPVWTLEQLKVCTDNNGYIILLWSEAMETILNHRDVNDNSLIEMVCAHIGRLSILSLMQVKIQHFVVVCLDSNMSKDQIRTTLPLNLSQKTVHNVSLHNVPDDMPVEDLLEQEEFSDLRDLIVTLRQQLQFVKPDHQVQGKLCKY